MNAPNQAQPQTTVAAASSAPIAPSPEMLWERHGLEVFLFARTRLRDREQARDVCQQAFVQALAWLQKPSASLPAEPNYGAWLKRIAGNIIIDWYRSPARRLTKSIDTECDDVEGQKPENPREAAPAIRLESAHEIEALRHCMGSLEEPDRRLVEARALREQRYDVVAEQLGISQGNARVRFFRTLQVLRRCVEFRVHAMSGRA